MHNLSNQLLDVSPTYAYNVNDTRTRGHTATWSRLYGNKTISRFNSFNASTLTYTLTENLTQNSN